MKLKPELRREIMAAAKRHGMGGTLVEIGLRDNGAGVRTNNFLTWPENEDLWDVRRFSGVKELDDDPANPGCYALDLYLYSVIGRYHDTNLETNVYIFIRDGKLVLATNKDLLAKKMARDLGFPSGKGW